jgi:hypothetical protein
MARRKLTKKEETPELLKFREKRKWQISLRRYVLERSPCPAYAPYFGLDIQNIRKWFEYQFEKEVSWETFGSHWQFDHIIPVVYFDFKKEADLKLCWNFTNLRVELIHLNKSRGHRLDVLAAKSYFQELFDKTNYTPCLQLLQKIDEIELSEFVSSEKQQQFILENKSYLDMIENYSVFEFELLNSGRSIQEVKKEVDFLKTLGK